jgi:hypothetical protein
MAKWLEPCGVGAASALVAASARNVPSRIRFMTLLQHRGAREQYNTSFKALAQ